MRIQASGVIAGLFITLTLPLTAAADWTGTKGIVSIKGDSFISPDYSATQTRDYSYLSAGLRTAGLGPDNRLERMESGFQGQIDGQFAPQAPVMSYLNVTQLYHQESLVSFGRKLENWSDLDERWGLGLFQPQFRWNPLSSESQGLSGIFLHLRGDSEKLPWGLTMFASALYIPDQGAGYTVKDGKFEEVNPWFSTPPTQARFESTGVVDQIHYQIEKPDTNRIIFNTSYAAQFYIGAPRDGFSFQASYAYKPSNQLALGLDGDLTAKNTVDVRVNPTFYYHSVMSADAKYAGELFEVGVGALREKPQDPEFESNWNYASYGESTMTSPYAGIKLGLLKLRAMSLFMNEPTETAKGPKAGEIGGLLAHRYPFSSANAVEASTRFFWKRHEGIQAKTRYVQGSKGEFALWTGELGYQMDQRWSLTSRVLLVRSDLEQGKTVYSDYENNDSAQAGVLYVF